MRTRRVSGGIHLPVIAAAVVLSIGPLFSAESNSDDGTEAESIQPESVMTETIEVTPPDGTEVLRYRVHDTVLDFGKADTIYRQARPARAKLKAELQRLLS